MSLKQIQWNLLAQAANQVQDKDLAPYIELKWLLQKRTNDERFKRLFAQYYGLNAARLSAEFKQRFFEALFAFIPSEDDPYTPLLKTLAAYARKQSLPFSFVSKLVSIHDEKRPLYDRYVSVFFGLYPPMVTDENLRIAGFVAHLQFIQMQYADWANDQRFPTLVAPLLEKRPDLKNCHPHRLCDFLVWQAGQEVRRPNEKHT